MYLRRVLSGSLVFAFLFSFGQAIPALPQVPADKKLEDAIATLRHIDQLNLTKAEKQSKSGQIDAAWEVIKSFGDRGVLRLKQEILKVDGGTEKDDFFKLNASALLWGLGGLSEAESIARIWNSTPLPVQYRYVFYVAFAAAQTHDPRVLPMLKAILRDDKGKIYVSAHAMDVEWPLSHEFIWGSYGPKGLPALFEVFETSHDPVEIRSAMILLSQSHYLPALPKVRQEATSKQDGVRRLAIETLGRFGHPRDYEFLISGLSSKDPKELWHYVFALYEYEDVRAVPYLIPLLETTDDSLRLEVIATLGHLLTPASFDALKKYIPATGNAQEKKECEWVTRDIEEKLPAGYFKKPLKEQETVLTEIRNSEYFVKKGEPTLSHRQLLEAIIEWKGNGRLDAGNYGWVEERHILSAASADDLDSLLEVRSSLYARLSDECLYETKVIDDVVKQLGRGRYRETIGVSEKAEEK